MVTVCFILSVARALSGVKLCVQQGAEPNGFLKAYQANFQAFSALAAKDRSIRMRRAL